MTDSLKESSLASGELIIPSSLNFLAPTIIDGLIRVGQTNDGGYVIPECLIKETDVLVSLGVSDDWSFDEHFKKLNPIIQIHAYDHTISRIVFVKRLVFSIGKLCVGKSSLDHTRARLRLLKSYGTFFTGAVRHYQERVHNRHDLSYDVTLDKIFSRTNSDRVFLKIDIEGSEYAIIDDILRMSGRIVGMVIEFHDTDPLRKVFAASVKRLQERFEVVHLHANNWSGIAQDGLPDVLELTFIPKTRCQNHKKRTSLPIRQVDAPNNPTVADYKMTFIG